MRRTLLLLLCFEIFCVSGTPQAIASVANLHKPATGSAPAPSAADDVATAMGLDPAPLDFDQRHVERPPPDSPSALRFRGSGGRSQRAVEATADQALVNAIVARRMARLAAQENLRAVRDRTAAFMTLSGSARARRRAELMRFGGGDNGCIAPNLVQSVADQKNRLHPGDRGKHDKSAGPSWRKSSSWDEFTKASKWKKKPDYPNGECFGHGTCDEEGGEESKANWRCACDDGYFGEWCELTEGEVRKRTLFGAACTSMGANLLHQARAALLNGGFPCYAYKLDWREEAVRACRALKTGPASCSEDDEAYFCQHDPECPDMCRALHRGWCSAAVAMKLQRKVPPWEQITESAADITDRLSEVVKELEQESVALSPQSASSGSASSGSMSKFGVAVATSRKGKREVFVEPTPPCMTRQVSTCEPPCKWKPHRVGGGDEGMCEMTGGKAVLAQGPDDRLESTLAAAADALDPTERALEAAVGASARMVRAAAKKVRGALNGPDPDGSDPDGSDSGSEKAAPQGMYFSEADEKRLRSQLMMTTKALRTHDRKRMQRPKTMLMTSQLSPLGPVPGDEVAALREAREAEEDAAEQKELAARTDEEFEPLTYGKGTIDMSNSLSKLFYAKKIGKRTTGKEYAEVQENLNNVGVDGWNGRKSYFVQTPEHQNKNFVARTYNKLAVNKLEAK